MTSLDRRHLFLALGLAALAGFVDAVAYVELGGFFVSFMSGNSTRMGAGAIAEARGWQIAGALILAFLAGVTGGSLLGRRTGAVRQRVVLAGVSLLLAVGAVLAMAGLPIPAGLAMAAAMGMENSVFEQNGRVQFGLTYMTGAVVRIGQLLAARLAGEPEPGLAHFAALWLALLLGAIAGAAGHALAGMIILWGAAAAAAVAARFAPVRQ